jgi:hypothetical protein
MISTLSVLTGAYASPTGEFYTGRIFRLLPNAENEALSERHSKALLTIKNL